MDHLNRAKRVKDNEFYTQYKDVEDELSKYPKSVFMNKVIYCPCDSDESAFVKYFKNHTELGYKKLIYTCLDDGVDMFSDYANNLFNECDIVVTNPPFSYEAKLIDKLYKMNKKFILIGAITLITNKGIKSKIIENKFHAGFRKGRNAISFVRPDGSIKEVCAIWYHNLDDINIQRKQLSQYKTMQDLKDEGIKLYKYDNYDALDCKDFKNCPIDYYGEIGLPISCFNKLDRDLFDVVMLTDDLEFNDDRVFYRIVVKRKI